MQLDNEKKRKIEEKYARGSQNFTQKDLDKVMTQEETALQKGDKLGKQIENFKTFWSLLKDYTSGNYKNVPWKFIGAVGFAVAYLISPVDVIPDVIPLLGFVDDAAVFAMVVKAFGSEIEAYRIWKETHRS